MRTPFIAGNWKMHLDSSEAASVAGELAGLCGKLEGIDMAVTWGVNQLMLNAGQWAYGVSREEAWNKAVRFLQRVCDYAAPREVFIAVESEPYAWFLIKDIRLTEQWVADVGRPNRIDGV